MKTTTSGFRWAGLGVLLAGLLTLPLVYGDKLGARDFSPSRMLPEFTARDAGSWINSLPLTRADLVGKVTLVDIWTFDCWNCYRSFPWLKEVEDRYQDRGLRVVGIHAPEFSHERDRLAVERKVREFGLHHPVMLDNDLAYWNALGNRYWPAYYLVDRQGRLRHVFVGETHKGDARAQLVEARIEQLLAE